MKPVKIGMSFLLFIVVFTFISLNISPSLSVPQNTWEAYLQDFDKHLQEYKASANGPVILGPSYAAQLDSFPPFHNLAIMGANARETLQTIHYVKPNDHVFYLFTLRELSMKEAFVKHECGNAITRRCSILRFWLRTKSGLTDTKSFAPIVEPLLEPSKSEIAFIQSFLKNDVTAHPYKLAKRIKICAAADLSEFVIFEEMHRRHPNIVFVFQPTFPFENVSEDGFGRNIKKIEEKREQLRQLFVSRGFDFLDLSSALPQSHFHDYYHLTSQGMEREKQLLISAL